MATSMASRFCQRSLMNVVKNAQRRSEISHLNFRNYARGTWRGLRDVLNVDEDKVRWKNEIKIKNPRKNPYVNYESHDPVHRSMASGIWEQSGSTSQKNFQRVSNKESSTKQQIKVKREERAPTPKTKSLPSYEKVDQGDTRFGQAIMSAKSRKVREQKNIVLLEGFRLIQDAIESGATAKCIYFSDKEFLERLQLVENVPLYKVTYNQLKVWSDMQTPAGIMAIFEKPKQGECPNPLGSCLPLTLICDSVRDPGNMGTLIRTAAAIGCQRVFTTKGCVDVWEPKVLRAGMGSHFHIPILAGIPWDILFNYVEDTSQILVAETEKEDLKRPADCSLFLEDTDEVHSDIHNISTLEMTRREKYSSFTAENSSELQIDKAYLDKDHLKKFSSAPLEYVSYEKVKCSESQVAVIIGGETTGVSHAAKKFAFDRYGQCVTIPMSPTVNSLNSAVAASVILYEIRKQLILKQN